MSDYIIWEGEEPKWKDFDALLRRNNLQGQRQVNWDPLLINLNNLIGEAKWFDRGREDEWLWKRSSSGCFSIRKTYEYLERIQDDVPNSFWKVVWLKNLIPKINCFWWTATHGNILTIDNLVKRGF